MELQWRFVVLLVMVHFTCMSWARHSSGFSSFTEAEPEQKWNYVDVRPDAHMFWWLYYTSANEGFKNRPLILWLQGGPGGSSTGFGNFGEIGPLDVQLTPRKTTWLSQASLLFIDNPVGTGYSYVTSQSAYATNNKQIADDLLTVLKAVLKQLPEFQTIPFYIFSESYGGKMTAGFSQVLNQAVVSGALKCNFQGFAMGDSWISPMDSVLTWGPYLYATSLVAKEGLDKIDASAQETLKAVQAGEFTQATKLWQQTEDIIISVTYGVNFYNILKWGADEQNADTLYWKPQRKSQSYIERLYERHVKVMQNDALSTLMNGKIRQKLGIIPQNVTWGGQSGEVFQQLSGDFMKPVIDVVDDLLMHSNLKVIVYSGQLDLIVDTMGTELWVQKLKWPGLENYNQAKRKALHGADNSVVAYIKEYKNFSFYWILNAGHMVPADAGDTALQMIENVFKELQ